MERTRIGLWCRRSLPLSNFRESRPPLEHPAVGPTYSRFRNLKRCIRWHQWGMNQKTCSLKGVPSLLALFSTERNTGVGSSEIGTPECIQVAMATVTYLLACTASSLRQLTVTRVTV